MKNLKMKIINILMSLSVALLAFTSLPASPAAAAIVGPIDVRSVAPGSTALLSGFPAWYRDDNGVAVELMPVNAIDNLIGPPDPLNPYEAKLGFNTAFYWNAADDGTVTFPNGGTFKIVFGYEATWVTGAATVGQENVFSRIRVFLKPGVPGTYLFQHPWGQDSIVVTAVDVANNRQVRFSDDVGAGIPRDFTTAIGPAARETTFLKSLAAPPGKLGDGVTAGPVTGGKVRNNVIISGPAGTVTINNFIVAGRLFAGIPPVASFTTTPTTGAAPLTVNFADTSIGPAAEWNWNFGDGSANVTGTPIPTHIYSTAGTFTATLMVNNVVGPASTTTRPVVVTAPVTAIPVASFVMNSTAGAAPLPVAFTDTSTGAPTTWQWNFGDGRAPSAIQNPNHTYLTAGTFTVTELISNALGSAATSKIITVTPPVPAVPVASFTMTPPVGVAPLAVKFTDTTTGVPTAWSWSFGDGGTSTLQNPTHTFTTVGLFAVTETVTNALGTSSASQVVTTGTLPAAPSVLTANVSSATQVNLTWVDNSVNEQLFMIQRATNAAFTLNPIEVHTLANATTFSDITATPSTTFFYRVLAGGLVGNSAPSNVVTVTTPAAGAPVPPPPPPPPPPAPVPAPAPAPAPAPSPAPIGGGGGGGGGGGAPAGPTFSPVTLNGLVTGTGLLTSPTGSVQFDAQVKTTNDDVVLTIPAATLLTDSSSVGLSTLTAAPSATPPAPPAGERIITSYTMGPNGAQFNPGIGIMMRFDPAKLPAGVTSSQLYMAFHDGTKWVKIDSTLEDASKTLTASITHFTEFAVIAPAPPVPSAPPPPPSPAPLERDEIIAPAVPQGLTAIVNADSQVILHWNELVGNQNGFMVERSQDKPFAEAEDQPGTPGLAEFHLPAGTTTFTDITVAPGKTYYYQVLAVTGVGHSEPSNVVSVSIPVPATTPAPATPATPATPPASTTPATPSTPSKPATSLNWGLITGIGAAIVIVIAVLAVAITRKKPAGQ